MASANAFIDEKHRTTLAPLFGDTLALLSALFYALYVTLLKVQIREESRIDMQLFFGFVGLFNIIGTWPIGVLLHLTGLERFELPHTSKTIVALVINVRFDTSFDQSIIHSPYPLDVYNTVERFYLRHRHAEDNTARCHDRPFTDYAPCCYW